MIHYAKHRSEDNLRREQGGLDGGKLLIRFHGEGDSEQRQASGP